MIYCSEYTSGKIRVLSFLAMVTVVSIHSGPFSLMTDLSSATLRMAGWIGDAQRWAVPFFFLVSGFFFSRYLQTHEDFRYAQFMRGKWRGLILPYLLWGAVYGTVVSVPLAMIVNHGHGDPLLKGTVIAAGGVVRVIDRMVGVFCTAPANGALWYVRMLIIFFVLAPVWRFVQRRCPALFWVGLPLAIVYGVSGMNPNQIAVIGGLPVQVTFGAVGFLLLGMCCAVHRVDEWRSSWIAAGSALVLAFVFKHCAAWTYLAPTCWAVAFWSLYDLMPKFLPKNLPGIFSLSFWIYCMHHSLCGYVGAGLRMVLGKSGDVSCWIQFFAIPLIVVLIGFSVACFVSRVCPRVFATLNGGR